MALRDLKLPEATVKIPGGEFAVRGLSLNDASWLIGRHGPAMQQVFQELVDEDNPQRAESMVDIAVPLLRSAPALCMEVIALAADDLEAVELVAKLPLSVQVEAIEKIGELTFAAEGGAKKFIEAVTRMAVGTTTLLGSLKA